MESFIQTTTGTDLKFFAKSSFKKFVARNSHERSGGGAARVMSVLDTRQMQFITPLCNHSLIPGIGRSFTGISMKMGPHLYHFPVSDVRIVASTREYIGLIQAHNLSIVVLFSTFK